MSDADPPHGDPAGPDEPTTRPLGRPRAADDEVTQILPRASRAEDTQVTRIQVPADFETTQITRIQPQPDPDTTQVDPAARAAASAATAGSPVTRIQTAGLDMTARPAAPRPQTLPGVVDSEAPVALQVGRYVIKDKLGRGGMATVYRAHDPGIGRDVAIKFLHAALCGEAEFRERFLREARAAGGLSHPNIVTVHDVGEIDGRPYMAMELLVGEPLSDLMLPGQPLPVRDVLVMGIQLARALDYAHAHGIVHRDIKPGNIVRLQGSLTIKVTDFGIAHIEATGAGEPRTHVGDVLGTPQYMSPEQTEGDRLDGRSDLFSVGIVLHQMLAGRRPFEADSLVALAVKIAKEEAPSLARLRPELPAGLRRAVERCLAKAPDRRFQSGRELSEALSRVLSEIDEAARQAERPRIVPLRVKWATGMALIVALVMGLTATVIKQRQDAALMDQVADYGASLARFIAAQNAVAALAEDWPVVDVAVQEILKTGDYQGITVIDRGGVVRASGDAAQIGQPYRAPEASALGTRGAGVTLTRYSVGGESVLGFNAPITFQNKNVGRVALALNERPLVRVARVSLLLMAVLVVVTVLAVAVAMYVVANWFARPIQQVCEALDEMAQGHFAHRIAEPRNDEFGLLFGSFDRMAQALQDASENGGATLAMPTSAAAAASLAARTRTTQSTPPAAAADLAVSAAAADAPTAAGKAV